MFWIDGFSAAARFAGEFASLSQDGSSDPCARADYDVKTNTERNRSSGLYLCLCVCVDLIGGL